MPWFLLNSTHAQKISVHVSKEPELEKITNLIALLKMGFLVIRRNKHSRQS